MVAGLGQVQSSGHSAPLASVEKQAPVVRQQPVSVPLEATYDGKLDSPVSVTASDPMVLLFTNASGVSAALGGAYTSTYPHLLDAASGLFAGRQKITTADGSTLLVLLRGRAIPKQDAATHQPSPTEYALTAVVGTIEGGTGKFKNASGKYTGEGEVSLATRQVHATFKGQLTL